MDKNMKRKIIEINEALCNGCGICAEACHESAIQMIDGKAKLVSDQYCDGLGDCLPACPTGAITMIEREADAYSQNAVDAHLAALGKPPMSDEIKIRNAGAQGHSHGHGGGCPGSRSQRLKPQASTPKQTISVEDSASAVSQLATWPVQLHLVNPAADYLKNADLLIAADCTAFAYGNFHSEFIKGKVTMIGCPKLDDNNYYTEKLSKIFADNAPNSITVVRMEVPCCGGIISAVKTAMLQSSTIVPYREVTITVDGRIK